MASINSPAAIVAEAPISVVPPLLLEVVGQYYSDVRDLKAYFIRNCGVDKKYEAFKVWAHWLVRNLCEVSDNYHIIPNQTIASDPHIDEHLKTKGCSDSRGFYQAIVARTSALYAKYNQFKQETVMQPESVKLISRHIEYSVTRDDDGNRYHQFKFRQQSAGGATYIKHNDIKYRKLRTLYTGDAESFNFYMFEVGFNYYILDGHSLQWCVPPKVFQTLQNSLDVKTELFASPTNSILPMYCSLFHVDKQFGAMDNFFNLDPHQLLNGTFEVNPPFIENVFIKSSSLVVNFLDQSASKDDDLMFVYIMPAWLDSEGYKKLVTSAYLIDEIKFEAYRHSYYQSTNDRMVQANFSSHVLIIGTPRSRLRWSAAIRQEIIRNFTYYDRKFMAPIAKVE